MKKLRLWILASILIPVSVLASAPLIWESSQYGKFLTTLGFTFYDGKRILTLTADPSTGGGFVAPIGSIGLRDNSGTGEGWFKVGSGNTAWTNFLTGATGWGLTGNSGTTAGTNFLGTNDGIDLVLKTNATERLRITSSGGYDTTLGAGVLHSDASGILTSSTIINADVDAAAGIVDTKLATIATSGKVSNSATTATSANTASAIVARDASGNFSAGTVTAALSGNASTATALAANPTDCSPGDFANAIDASGNLTCATPATGTGDVVGPGSATDNAIARFDGTTGKLIKNSGVTLDNSANLAGVSGLTMTGTLDTALGAGVVHSDSSGVFTSSGIVSSDITDGTIVNADINASAAIDFSKLASLTSTNILVGSAGNVATSVAMSGDVTISNTGVTAIGANKVTNSQLAQVATQTFKGRTSGSTGNVEDLTATQATAILNAMVGDSGSGGTKGLVPAPASGDAAALKFLKADGTWAAAAGGYVAPTVQKFTSSSGTYTTPANVVMIRVRMVGGGGGGAGSGTAGTTNGGNGGDSTFGSSLLSAGGGSGGATGAGAGGTGGTASLGTGPIGLALTGASGGGSSNTGATNVAIAGGDGGGSCLGGGGGSGRGGAAGLAGATNTGSGGGGGGFPQTSGGPNSGAGGGSGGCIDALISSPAGSYAYSVGTSGTAGSAGTNGFGGGAGAAGYIEVTEYYANGAIGTATSITQSNTAGQWLVGLGSSASSFTNTTTTGKMVDGSADEVQLTVQGHSTQTSDILLVEKSDGTDVLNVTNVNGTKIRGTTTNDAAATGFVGEYVESVISSYTNFPSTTTYGDLTSITLGAGDWEIDLQASVFGNGATTTSYNLGISTNSGNSGTGLVIGNNAIAENSLTTNQEVSKSISPYRVSISGSTTYYFKYRSTFTGGPPQAVGRISARRVR